MSLIKSEQNLIECQCCHQKFKKLTSSHLVKHKLTREQYNALYDPDEHRVDVLFAHLNKYYILNRRRFVLYKYNKNTLSMVPRTIDINNSTYRKFGLTDSELKDHIRGKKLLGIYFAPRVTKVMGLDLDSHSKGFLRKVIILLYKLGFSDENFLISTSGIKGYHIDIYFDCFIYKNMVDDLFRYICKSLDLSEEEKTKIECRGNSDQAYKLPFGVRFVKGIDVNQNCCTPDGDIIDKKYDALIIRDKVGLSAQEVRKLFMKAGLKFNPCIHHTTEEREQRYINRSIKKAADIIGQNHQKKGGENANGAIVPITQKKPGNSDNLINTYENLYMNFGSYGKSRCQDLKRLLLIRNGTMDNNRNNFLYCYASAFKGQFTTEYLLLKEITKINNMFVDPLDESDLNDIVTSVLSERQKSWKTETIIKRFHITTEEQMQLQVICMKDIINLHKNERRRIQRKERKALKVDTILNSISEMLCKGMTTTEIGLELKVSKRTIERYRKKLPGKIANTEDIKQLSVESLFDANA